MFWINTLLCTLGRLLHFILNCNYFGMSTFCVFVPDKEIFSETYVGCTASYFVPTGDAYSSGHLVLSHIGFANVLLLRALTLNHTFHQLMTHFPDLTFNRI